MTIPLNTGIVNNAVVVNPQYNPVPLKICSLPPEDLKCLSFQLDFNTINPKRSFLVDLSGGSTPPLSQIACMYVDATDCSRDIIILFTDTGFEITIKAGNTQLVPILSATQIQKFYVAVPPNQIFIHDVVNIFLMNQFIPEFSNQNFVDSILTGTDQYAAGRYSYPAQIGAFTNIINLTTTAKTAFPTLVGTGGSRTALYGLQWYLRVKSTIGDEPHELYLFDDDSLNNPMMIFPFISQVVDTVTQLLPINFSPGILDGLTAAGLTAPKVLIDAVGSLTVCKLYSNVQIANIIDY